MNCSPWTIRSWEQIMIISRTFCCRDYLVILRAKYPASTVSTIIGMTTVWVQCRECIKCEVWTCLCTDIKMRMSGVNNMHSLHKVLVKCRMQTMPTATVQPKFVDPRMQTDNCSLCKNGISWTSACNTFYCCKASPASEPPISLPRPHALMAIHSLLKRSLFLLL